MSMMSTKPMMNNWTMSMEFVLDRMSNISLTMMQSNDDSQENDFQNSSHRNHDNNRPVRFVLTLMRTI